MRAVPMTSDVPVPDRRHFLKHMAGMSLLAVPGLRFVQGLAQAAPDLNKRHKSVIIPWMGAGPATIDLWDLKPDSPNGGEFKPINTAASGVQICEHLPSVAKQMKHLSVVRSLETTEGDHNRGTVLMNTGRSPSPLVQYPALGAVAAQQLTPKDLDLPSFISIGGTAQRIGQGFLLARNLVEAGAVCVEVDFGGWDNHQNIFPTLKTKLPTLDKAMAALVEDLMQSGMWQDTVVVWMGEFGRTPRINQNAGRDHWPKCWSVVVGGGGLKGGQAYGATTKDGTDVADGKCSVGDLYATLYQALGLDPKTDRDVRD